jgi:DNA-binding beta-propeller fold protein YncE
MLLGACRLKRVAFVLVLFAASMSFFSCGSYHAPYYLPPSGLTTRVLVSQSVATAGAAPGLFIVDGFNDTIARGGISAGSSPGLMALSPDRSTLIVFDSVSNNVDVVNAKRESLVGTIPLPGPTSSMVMLGTGYGYAAVPSAPLIGFPPGAVVVMNVPSTFTSAIIGVPNAQTVAPSPDGTAILVFSADSDAITVLSPLLVNTGNPATVTVAGFDRPVNAVFSADGSTAYVLNCGPQCGSGTASPSIQIMDMATLTLQGAALPVDGATIGWLNGSTLYVAGTSPTNNLCTGQTTLAPTCGRLDIIDLGAFAVTSSVVITDGYHDRIDMSINGQLFIGSYGCSIVGNVYNPQGEVRGCLSIFDTTTPGNTSAVIPPDNGDVTGLQSFTSRYVEYVAEGGNVRVYDTTIDKLLINDFVTTGTINIPGKMIDVKAIDFF